MFVKVAKSGMAVAFLALVLGGPAFAREMHPSLEEQRVSLVATVGEGAKSAPASFRMGSVDDGLSASAEEPGSGGSEGVMPAGTLEADMASPSDSSTSTATPGGTGAKVPEPSTLLFLSSGLVCLSRLTKISRSN